MPRKTLGSLQIGKELGAWYYAQRMALRMQFEHLVRKHPWLAGGIPILLAVMVGMVGHWQYFSANSNPHHDSFTLADCLHGTLLMFVLDGGFVQPGNKPFIFEVARFLAPMATISSFIVALIAFWGKSFCLRRIRNHVVVCGLGKVGLYIAHCHRAKGDYVVIIDEDWDDIRREDAQGSGILVVNGTAQQKETLRKARIEQAACCYVICGDDAINLEVAARIAPLSVGRRQPLVCHIHLAQLRGCGEFRSMNAFGHLGTFAPSAFNSYDHVVRTLFLAHPLDRCCIQAGDRTRVHLVLSNLDLMGEAILLHVLQNVHLANLAQPVVTLFTPESRRQMEQFLFRYPNAGKLADIRFADCHLDSPKGAATLLAILAEPEQLLTIAINLPEASAALSVAMNLPGAIYAAKIPVWVRLESTGHDDVHLQFLNQVMKRGGMELIPFGTMQDSFQVDGTLDACARVIHENYRESRRRDGTFDSADPALADWLHLDHSYKESNRQQADHIPVKLRVLGYTLSAQPSTIDLQPELTAETVETLARMEHQRWIADRILSGWTSCPLSEWNTNKTDMKKACRTPYLIPYAELPGNVQEYDRIPVRKIPDYLQTIGKHVHPIASALDV